MATRQYIGARYVPKFATPTEWNSALSYEGLTIVTHLGNSFTSKKPVPAGIDISNTDYWAVTGNYNAQVEQYRQEVEKIKTDVTDVKDNQSTYNARVDQISYLFTNKKILIVGDSISDENINWNDNIKNVWVFPFRNIVEKFGAQVTNLSYSSRGYSVVAGGSTLATVLDTVDLSQFDIIIMFGGVNDFLQGVKLSTFYEQEDGSFWKSIMLAAQKLRSSHAKVFIVSPMCTTIVDNSLYNLTLDMYRTCLYSMSQENGFYFINGSCIPFFGGACYNTDDGLHPLNDYTHYIAEYIFEKIISGGEDFTNHLEIAERKNMQGTNCTYTIESKTLNGEIIYDLYGTATGEFEIALPNVYIYDGRDRIATVTGNEVTKMVVLDNKINVYGSAVNGEFRIQIRGYSNSLMWAQFFRH